MAVNGCEAKVWSDFDECAADTSASLLSSPSSCLAWLRKVQGRVVGLSPSQLIPPQLEIPVRRPGIPVLRCMCLPATAPGQGGGVSRHSTGVPVVWTRQGEGRKNGHIGPHFLVSNHRTEMHPIQLQAKQKQAPGKDREARWREV
ncbi:hypothetical protein CPLU01_01054 [Colletotrichum plurivorum]|uniref:Uncharacterized protein n=1 Tax=Colletotrichum plurivorum TaxID=2175906 RepID=A0A8H6NQJ3_9PEZI|nr:hypothetical protein CPLU01_01054 [Colletotrichum plurivorum]